MQWIMENSMYKNLIGMEERLIDLMTELEHIAWLIQEEESAEEDIIEQLECQSGTIQTMLDDCEKMRSQD